MIPQDLTYERLIKDMSDCSQTTGMSVLQHGLTVKDYFDDLISGEPFMFQWKLPDWFEQNRDFIVGKLIHADTISRYLIHHDCGKPYCRTIDENDRQHFNDHANVSTDVWKQLYPEDVIVTELIQNDMVIHTIKSEDVESFSKNPLVITLMCAGLAEIHANASMFGGIESTSFKIKWKQIDRKGKQLVERLK